MERMKEKAVEEGLVDERRGGRMRELRQGILTRAQAVCGILVCIDCSHGWKD